MTLVDQSAELGSGVITRCADDPGRSETFIPSPCVQNHAANLMPLANGDLGCVWFGGTQEGMADISIYFSRLVAGTDRWTWPRKLSDDATRSEQNPILFPTPDGSLWLIWTAQISGNQDTAFVRRRISADNGQTWGPIETLFGRQGESGIFIRQPLLVLDNGDWLLPMYYCDTAPGQKWVGDNDTSAVRISSDRGRTWREVRIPGSVGCVHMNIEQLGDGSLLALFRSRWADHIYESRSHDRGGSWSAPTPASLPNNNSSIQFTRLSNGHLALVFNDINASAATERRTSLYDEIEDEATPTHPRPETGGRAAFWGTPRAPMTLAISRDDGRSWIKRNIEVGDGYCMTNNSRDRSNRELSYPSIKQTNDGAIHVAYTHFRQAIKYVRMTEAWVSGEAS
jgi:predicted neuraminidase